MPTPDLPTREDHAPEAERFRLHPRNHDQEDAGYALAWAIPVVAWLFAFGVPALAGWLGLRH